MADRQTIVITGGAGFIGSHMVDCALEGGYQVRVIDNLSGGREANLDHHAGNPDLQCEWADIRDLEPDAAVFKGADRVVHFAGIGEFDGITAQIEQNLTQAAGIADEKRRYIGIDAAIELHAFFMRLDGHSIGGQFDGRPGIEIDGLQGKPAGFDL